MTTWSNINSHLYVYTFIYLLYFLSTTSWSYNFSYIFHSHNFSTLSYLSFQGMPPARARRPPKRLGAESVETLHNPDVTDVSVPEHEETSTLSSSKAKRLTMTDVSKTLLQVQQQQLVMQQQIQDFINSQQQSDHSDQTLTLNNSATASRIPDNQSINQTHAAASSHSGDHLVNSPHAAGTLNFLKNIAKEADNENIEDDLMISDDDTKSEGECPVQFNSQRPVFSGGLTVSQSIPQKIKVKIWKHKYIDFSDLLNPHASPEAYTVSLNSNSLFSKTPALTFQQKNKKQLSEFDWNIAWDSYMSVYLQKFPNQLEKMLTYHQHIQRMMSKQANWRYYDYHFRVDREYIQFDWDTVRPDLDRETYSHSFRAQQNANKSQQYSNKNQNINTSQQVPKGYCFAYNSVGRRCTKENCSFKHSCPECQGKHAKFQHSKFAKQQNTTYTSQS